MEPPPRRSTRSSIPPPSSSAAAHVRGYRILRRLATGGTSDVLLAQAQGPHGFARTVVLKVLLQQFRGNPEFVGMFAREAAAYARLSHPAIVKLFDFFEEREELVMVLEYVDGLPLHKLRALLQTHGRTLDDSAAMFVAWRIFGALSAAHTGTDPRSGEACPVIHRDVNPSNVLLPWDGHVKIADFGIAKVVGTDGETKAGLIKGTYGYMAPEQVRGESLTVRADVYAACLVLWELLARRKAIVRGTASDLDILRAMAEPSFPSLDVLRPELPKVLLAAIAQGLEPDPARRTISAQDLCHALRAAASLDAGRENLVDALTSVRSMVVVPNELAATRPTRSRAASDNFPDIRGQPPLVTRSAPPRPPPLVTRSAPPRPPPLPPRPSAPPAQPPRSLQSARPPPLAAAVADPAYRLAAAASVAATLFAPVPAPFVSLPPPPHTMEGKEEPSYRATSHALWTKAHGGRAALVTGGALLSLFAVALAMWGDPRPNAPPPPTPSLPPEAPPARPIAASTPPPAAPSTEPTPLAPSPTTGNLSVSSSRGHRIWVDGKLAGQAPFSLPIGCGRHAVRIGGHGVIRHVDVPCGGDVDVH
ncbi:MAG: serine/threonine protein kinase [Myxococcota bacterium]|nr:serine/threonine protein kinase [Myxococcota bacterium]